MVTTIGNVSIGHYLEQFSKVHDSLPGDALLSKMRLHAMQNFVKNGFPDRKDEQWKYTSLYSLAEKKFQIVSSQRAVSLDIKPLTDWYIFLDEPNNYQLPDGIILHKFSDGLQNPNIIKYLNKSTVTHPNPLLDFNLALMSQGYIIEVNENTRLTAPIHIICGSSLNGVTTNIRNILIVKENAEVSFIEHYIGDNQYFNNITTEIFLSRNAKCCIDSIQEESADGYHIADLFVNQQDNSHFSWNSFSFGGLMARNYVEIELNSGAECNLQGISVLTTEQHVDHNILITHLGSNSSSSEEFKGVYAGKAHGVFRGDIRVNKEVKNIISKQLNKNILLSDSAKVSTQPRLEIYNNDVQCSHGATVGQLDKETLFYLQTRGLSEDSARRILIIAFVQSILENVNSKEVADYLELKLDKILLDI